MSITLKCSPDETGPNTGTKAAAARGPLDRPPFVGLFTMGNIMGMQHPSGVSWSVLTAAAVVLAAPLRADLAEASPFLPGNADVTAAAAGPAGPLELRGVMSTPDGLAYCIYESAKKKDVWVGVNETGHDFVVKSADSSSDSVSVQYQGRSVKLTLRTAKVASAGPAAAAPVGAPNAVNQVALNPSPADEQRRLDAVAQEVRRRKQEREKAVLDSQNGVTAPPAPNR
jgi:hypothetical protein